MRLTKRNLGGVKKDNLIHRKQKGPGTFNCIIQGKRQSEFELAASSYHITIFRTGLNKSFIHTAIKGGAHMETDCLQ